MIDEAASGGVGRPAWLYCRSSMARPEDVSLTLGAAAMARSIGVTVEDAQHARATGMPTIELADILTWEGPTLDDTRTIKLWCQEAPEYLLVTAVFRG